MISGSRNEAASGKRSNPVGNATKESRQATDATTEAEIKRSIAFDAIISRFSGYARAAVNGNGR